MQEEEIGNLESASNFCRLCGNLIELPEVMEIVECNRCGFKVLVGGINNWMLVFNIGVWSEIDSDKDRVWWEEAVDWAIWTMRRKTIRVVFGPQLNQSALSVRTTHFWTRQLRSADEGSAVFYECVKNAGIDTSRTIDVNIVGDEWVDKMLYFSFSLDDGNWLLGSIT